MAFGTNESAAPRAVITSANIGYSPEENAIMDDIFERYSSLMLSELKEKMKNPPTALKIRISAGRAKEDK